ncbi:2848_t:CDS:2 [Diversispora eburnea]|uniref:2848_t:CDS:1 n=1 Tax=Diversispora eburnea TaxID=1213867 RepID=A0A9N8ZV37_9GLOM|nr:2848_t:CDS:2 [Diversispora eburnea]
MTHTMKQTRKRVDTQKKNGLMQRGQQKIKLTINKPRGCLPPLPLPYPPEIDLQKMVAKLASKPKLARFPNAFIMYRNEYVHYLKSKDLHLSMTELSPMIAASWKQEPEYVKDAYTQLSSEAEKLYVRVAANAQPEIKYKFPSQQRHPTFNDFSSQDTNIMTTPRKNNDITRTLINNNFTKYEDIVSEYNRLLESPSPTFLELKGFPRTTTLSSSSITRSRNSLEETSYFPWPSKFNNNESSSLRDTIQQSHISSTSNIITCEDLGITFPESSIIGQLPPSPALDTPCSENALSFSPTCPNCIRRHFYDHQPFSFSPALENQDTSTIHHSTNFYPPSPVSPVQPFTDESSQSPNFGGEFEVSDITNDLYYVIDPSLSSGPYTIPTSSR